MSLVERLRKLRDAQKSQLEKDKHAVEVSRINIWTTELEYQEEDEEDQIIRAAMDQRLRDHIARRGEDAFVTRALRARAQEQAHRAFMKRQHDSRVIVLKNRVRNQVARIEQLKQVIAEAEKHLKAVEEANHRCRNLMDGEISRPRRRAKRRRCD